MNDFQPTNWRPPLTDKEVRVRFRNGDESKWTYLPRQLRWTDTGSDFDVIAWKEI